MSVGFFSSEYTPVARRGFTPIEAVEFMRTEFPNASQWTCWAPPYLMARLLSVMVGKGYQPSGTIGSWRWSRVPCSYPKLAFWDGQNTASDRSDDWIGALKIDGPKGETFLLFSFLNSKGVIGEWYLASTHDAALLDCFAQAVREHFHPSARVTIEVHGGPDIILSTTADETIFLPDRLREDVEQQVYSFFENSEKYRQLRLRYRRGYLFVGPPGNGKTMLLRHLVRQCHRRYRAAALMLTIARRTNDDDVTMLFAEAVRKAPALVILEDVDSLTSECHVARAHLLAQLDGPDHKEGLLVIGTTNNPEQIDPALVHRPSRFDRVWQFPLPDQAMRQRYLQWACPGLDADALAAIANRTDDWSYAFLNELRTTAAILAMGRNAPEPTAEDFSAAFALLLLQFQAGRHNHATGTNAEPAGFSPTEPPG